MASRTAHHHYQPETENSLEENWADAGNTKKQCRDYLRQATGVKGWALVGLELSNAISVALKAS